MSLARLRRISYLFPDHTPAERRFFADLARLLGEVPDCLMGAVGLTLPVTPGAALPGTSFVATDVPGPVVLLAADLPLDLECGGLRLSSTATNPNWSYISPEIQLASVSTATVHGSPVPPVVAELPAQEMEPATLAALSPAELYACLHGHVVRLDHTGCNLPARHLTRAAWDSLLAGLVTVAAVYRYPSGADWPFVLPTTHDEYSGDITDFGAVREPKWELVYDGWATDPVIQIDLETDLTRPELAALFPAPVGHAFPDLAAYFRSVYLAHPWPHLLIRCDLRYRSTGLSDWDTGAWLVTAGGRI
ncbi:MAG: hypothetical protein M3Z04_21515 [Chloroflexota bacterium]|nr:hypothetical protein [Chloroflexota bacterium]